MERTSIQVPEYERPTVTVLGTVNELTLGCDKNYGESDGFTFLGLDIVCQSP